MNKQEHDNAAMAAASANPSSADIVHQMDRPDRPVEQTPAFDLAGIADEHFAISEERVDKDRCNYRGNWVVDRHNNFCEKYGQVMICESAAGDGAADVAPDDTSCQAVYCPGICCKQVARVKERYDALKLECNSLLRQLRSVRREKGYVPYHGVLLVLDGVAGSTKILELHLLCRVSFSPFGFTAVQMDLQPGSQLPVHATTMLSEGVAVMRDMSQLLYDLASNPSVTLGTAPYKAVSLQTIVVENSVSRLSDVFRARAPVGLMGEEGSDTDAEDAAISKVSGLLKRVFSTKAKAKAPPRAKKKQRTSSTPGERVVTTPVAVCDQVDAEIEQSWSKALADDAGAVPEPTSSASSASRAPRRRQHEESRAQQAAQQGEGAGTSGGAVGVVGAAPGDPYVPWKDSDGHCWIVAKSNVPPVTDELKKLYLGSWAFLFCELVRCCLYFAVISNNLFAII